MSKPTHIPTGTYLVTRQVAFMRHVRTRTVNMWISKGQLPAVKLHNGEHLISAEALAAFKPRPPGRPRK